ncbi:MULTISPECIES: hypothetical protein [Dietzia]|uniref:hypothetical protein n=1 Tax=Dietzia TaxID=37914 RepID=UPI000D08DB25|nr:MULTISPECIES: hypothetical protein [Dietzia]AVM65109.1 hypothetical protein C3V38_12725 [Dietzia sp. oral taxon 368]MCT1710416.1 hypothetical protein [Dietzia cinnamea]MCT2275232.1 hypothetical protein [Dietzia cinnamea]
MSNQPRQHSITIPQQGAPSDWHWFRPRRGAAPAPGDVALCGNVLGNNIDSLDSTGTGSGRAKWCPLCDHLVTYVREGLFDGEANA